MLHLLNGRKASMAMGRCQERREASTEDDPQTLFAADCCSLIHVTFNKDVFSNTKKVKKPDNSAELTVHRKSPELWIVE